MNDIEKARLTRDAREKYPAERERLLDCFENNKCPECGKNTDWNNDERNNFCGEKCYGGYIKKDQMFETNLAEAQGEFNYKHSSLNKKSENKNEPPLKKAA